MQIPATGLRAAETTFAVAADAVANAATPGYRPGRAELAEAGPGRGVAVTGVRPAGPEPAEGRSGAELADAIPQTVLAAAIYGANLAVLRTQAETTGALLSLRA